MYQNENLISHISGGKLNFEKLIPYINSKEYSEMVKIKMTDYEIRLYFSDGKCTSISTSKKVSQSYKNWFKYFQSINYITLPNGELDVYIEKCPPDKLIKMSFNYLREISKKNPS